jgi:hypothetical protein
MHLRSGFLRDGRTLGVMLLRLPCLFNVTDVVLSSIKSYNKLPLEIKNAAGNLKKFKTTLKIFCVIIHFTQLKSTLISHELDAVTQDFIIDIY